MARVLHLLKGDHAAEAIAVIVPQVTDGDDVTLALLGGAVAPALPARVTVRRVPEETSYDELLELIFTADSVITW